MVAVVDMFCGVGGLTHGFIQEDFNVVAGIDSDEACRFPYEHNNPGAQFIHKRIEDTSAADISNLFRHTDVSVLVGCAPCQPFSAFTNPQRVKEDQWRLVGLFADLIVNVQPDVVSMENVTRLKSFAGGEIFGAFVAKLKKHYHVTWFEVYGPDYGIPQHRKRLVLFASKRSPIDLIPATHTPDQYGTVASVLKSLPPIDAGTVCKTDPLHRARALSKRNFARIRQSKQGGTWEDWDPDLVAACHKRPSGKWYKNVYGRMVWEEPAPTITTQAFSYGTGRFGHPEQHRALSLREMALLQTFPQNYEFVEPTKGQYRYEQIGRWIGNAVPVDLGRIIARSIAQHLED